MRDDALALVGHASVASEAFCHSVNEILLPGGLPLLLELGVLFKLASLAFGEVLAVVILVLLLKVLDFFLLLALHLSLGLLVVGTQTLHLGKLLLEFLGFLLFSGEFELQVSDATVEEDCLLI